MVPHNTTSHCLGLAPNVVYRLEIGLAIVDDGDRTFRMPGGTFQDALGRISSAEREEPSEQLRSIFDAHPTVFVSLTESEARASVIDREV